MRTLVVASLFVLGCGGGSKGADEPAAFDPEQGDTSGKVVSSGSAAAPTPTPPTGNTPPSTIDSPQITRSGGVAGGIVILWPRIPASANDEATRQLGKTVQTRLEALARKARPNAPVDIRPEPERVCSRAGCTAISIGAAIMKNGGGCAIVATVSAPGSSPQTLVPWVGALTLKQKQAPFREPPESQILVSDYANCGDLTEAFEGQEGAIEAAIRAGQ